MRHKESFLFSWFILVWILSTLLSSKILEIHSPSLNEQSLPAWIYWAALLSQGAIFGVLVSVPFQLLLFGLVKYLTKSIRRAYLTVYFCTVFTTSLLTMLFVLNQQTYRALGQNMSWLMVRQAMQDDFLTNSGIPIEQIWQQVAMFAVCLLIFSLIVFLFQRWIRRVPLALCIAVSTIAVSLIIVDKGFISSKNVGTSAYRHLTEIIPFYLSVSAPPRGMAISNLSGDYPQAPFKGKIKKPHNVIIIVLESFRSRAMNSEIMPHSFALAQDGFVGLHHHSGSNCTQSGFFSLLYGTNLASLSSSVGRSHGSYPILWLREQGYKTAFFSSIAMGWMGQKSQMLRPSFETVNEVESSNPIHLRDQEMVSRFLSYQETNSSIPTFSVLFFNSTHHNYYYPPAFEKFKPVAPDFIEGDIHLFHTGLTNRYANAAHYIDSLIELIINQLKQSGMFEDTVIVITGDHGEAFYEHDRYFHATDLTFSQVGTPLVIHGISSLKGPYNQTTGHEQILPTILTWLSPGLNTETAGTGRPIDSNDAYPILSSFCKDLHGDFSGAPSDWIALFKNYKIPFTLSNSGIQTSAAVNLNDSALSSSIETTDTADLIRSKLPLSSFHDDQQAPLSNDSINDTNKCKNLGHDLFMCRSPAGWNQAKWWCEHEGMELATVVTPSELELVSETIQKLNLQPGVWVGARKSTTSERIHWINGQALLGPWESDGDPFGNPFTGKTVTEGNCVQSSTLISGNWTLSDCWWPGPFLCRGNPAKASMSEIPSGTANITGIFDSPTPCTKGSLIVFSRSRHSSIFSASDGLGIYKPGSWCNGKIDLGAVSVPVGTYDLIGIIASPEVEDQVFKDLAGGNQNISSDWVGKLPATSIHVAEDGEVNASVLFKVLDKSNLH